MPILTKPVLEGSVGLVATGFTSFTAVVVLTGAFLVVAGRAAESVANASGCTQASVLEARSKVPSNFFAFAAVVVCHL